MNTTCSAFEWLTPRIALPSFGQEADCMVVIRQASWLESTDIFVDPQPII